MNMVFSFVFGIDKNIIQIYNAKDIKLFYKDLIGIVLKRCQSIGQFKEYHLILEIIISSLESYFLLIFFANSHLMISICEVKLGKPPSLP